MSLFIIGHMGLFFYNKIGSIISIVDLPTTNIIEPLFSGFYFYHFILLSFGGRIFEKKKGSLTYEKITKNFCYI
ncbi:hypothetical protein EQH17_07825 [Streptococcus pneumoniae]|nr:hypothetical protein C3Y86_07575 [Streptococcus pneumoniae]UKP20612.1 hypothetical protein EQH44_07920 [Streptococcus pneumoniae]UKP70725.1 hypothetical protein EQH17_07825 [Streptococcus pneumoniae]BDS91058.1 hypothetical protein PC1528_15420 [Streptococcus pneumoniae]BEL35900.1 hypothetical protein TKY121527_16320 [Streptococcus pneumoniae]